MTQLYANNTATTLLTTINNSVTSVVVASGKGALFPSPSGSDYFMVTLDDGTNVEIMKCTGRSTDTLTVVRNQESTGAFAFTAGAKVEMRITSETMTRIGDSFTYFDPDKPPAAPSAYDDEFESAGAIGGLWTTVAWASATSKDVSTTVPGCLYVQAANIGRVLIAAVQLIPAGDFTIVTKVAMGNTAGTGDAGVGLIISDTNNGTSGTQKPFLAQHSNGNTIIGAWTNWATYGSIPVNVTQGEDQKYLRIRRSGTTYYFGTSQDGKTWSDVAWAPGFTPTYFGVCCTCNQAGRVDHSWEYFRYSASATATFGGVRTLGVGAQGPTGAAGAAYAMRVNGTTSSTTPTPNCDTTDEYTLSAQAATGTFGAPTGTPVNGQRLRIRVKDNGTTQTLAYNAVYVGGVGLPLPTCTLPGKILSMDFDYDTDNALNCWRLVGMVGGCIKTISSVTTLTIADGPTVLCTGTSYVLTLPTAVGNAGERYYLMNSSASGTITVTPNGAQTVGFLATWDLEKGDFIEIFSDNANWLVKDASYRMRTKLYTANGTHRFPQGCTWAMATCQAAGGGGGGVGTTTASGGGGGAGGACKTAYINPVPGTDYTVTIGIGGAGGANTGGTGVAGGDASIGALLSAVGGLAGVGNNAGAGGAGGAGVTAVTLATNLLWPTCGSAKGGTGKIATAAATAAYTIMWALGGVGNALTNMSNVTGGVAGAGGTTQGGGGGGTLFGNGANGAGAGLGASAAANSGAGGAGAYGTGTGFAGGVGGSGFVRVTWTQ